MLYLKGISRRKRVKKTKAEPAKQLTEADVTAHLHHNDIACDEKIQPDFPVLVLRIEDEEYVFNSLYRVWMIESIFSNVLEQKYRAENDASQLDNGE